jgi:hypothetical protein
VPIRRTHGSNGLADAAVRCGLSTAEGELNGECGATSGAIAGGGGGAAAFTISRETLVGDEFGDGMTLDDYIRAVGLPSGGAIRASLGLASNFIDIHRFMSFAGEFVDLTGVLDDLPPRIAC